MLARAAAAEAGPAPVRREHLVGRDAGRHHRCLPPVAPRGCRGEAVRAPEQRPAANAPAAPRPLIGVGPNMAAGEEQSPCPGPVGHHGYQPPATGSGPARRGPGGPPAGDPDPPRGLAGSGRRAVADPAAVVIGLALLAYTGYYAWRR